MAMKKAVESVCAGHPDKVCDQIADAIVDEYLRRDKAASLDLNVFASHGMMMIGGEVNAKADFDLSALAKKTYEAIGYEDDIEVFVNVEQSSEQMRSARSGASDTVVVHGYATKETRELMPRPVVFAHNVARRIDDLRKTDPSFHWLRPDGKVQVVMDRDQVRALTILASHSAEIEPREAQGALMERIVAPLVNEDGVQLYINPLGAFSEYGLRADSGMSGRRGAIDTYGGLIPHGAEALSGKDPKKAERAGAYMARYAARYLVEQELAASAMVTLVYTIGRPEPIHVEAVGMGAKSRGAKMDLTNLIKQEFDLRPEAIVERLGLAAPMYAQAAVYGHFGRMGFPWEEKVEGANGANGSNGEQE